MQMLMDAVVNGRFVNKVPGLVAAPSLLQKPALTGVTSFETYISDVIGQRFEKVRNGHRFENTGHQFESYIFIPECLLI